MQTLGVDLKDPKDVLRLRATKREIAYCEAQQANSLKALGITLLAACVVIGAVLLWSSAVEHWRHSSEKPSPYRKSAVAQTCQPTTAEPEHRNWESPCPKE